MLKITTWNVNGIRKRATEVSAFIAEHKPDVLCLQEIKASPEHVPTELSELANYHHYWHGHKGYSGVGLLLSRETFGGRPEFWHPEFDHETRIVLARAGKLVVASIYVPNGGKDFEAKQRFLDGLEQFVQSALAAGDQLILCGDLNVAREERDVHPSLRKGVQIGRTPEEQQQFERILGLGLVDLQRQFYPDDDRLFTWWAPWRNMRQKNVGWRIDYVLATAPLAQIALRCEVLRETGSSDHGPVVAEFDTTPVRLPQDAEPRQPTTAPQPQQGSLPF
jgi:exodeoxyribonuclease-3